MKAAETVDLMIAEHEAELLKLQGLKSDIALEIQESYDQGHTVGYTEGRAEQGTDLIYTEEEFQAKVAQATEALTLQVNEQQAIIEEIPVKVQQAVSEKIQALKSSYQASQDAEKAIEEAFNNELV